MREHLVSKYSENGGPSGVDHRGSAARLSSTEASIFAGRLEALARSGQPLSVALKALATETPSGPLSQAFNSLGRRLEAGEGLADSVEKLQDAVPAHLVGVIAAGERSGKLAELLGRYIEGAAKRARSRSELKRALAYPILIICLILPLMLAIIALTLSNAETFVSIFRDFGINSILPWRFYSSIEGTARLFKEFFWPIVLFGPALVLATALVLLIARRKGAYSNLARGLPLFGQALRCSALAEFCHVVGLLIDCKVDAREAVELAAKSTNDEKLVKTSNAAFRMISAGSMVGAALARRGLLGRGFGPLLKWGEANNQLPGALAMASEMFDARAKDQIALSHSVVLLLAWLAVGVMISLTVFTVYLPLVQFLILLSALADIPSQLGVNVWAMA
jgi:type II secretory pathway component PulF